MDFSVWKILLVLNKNWEQIWYAIVQYMLWDLFCGDVGQDHWTKITRIMMHQSTHRFRAFDES